MIKHPLIIVIHYSSASANLPWITSECGSKVTGSSKMSHVTQILSFFHWLHIKFTVQSLAEPFVVNVPPFISELLQSRKTSESLS